MLRRPDLSVGAWLSLGFGAAALLMAGVVAVAVGLLGRIERAERRQMELIRPRAVAAAALQEQLLRLGIAARTYALTRDERHHAAFREALARARSGEAALEATPDGEGHAGRAEALALVAPYRDAAEALVAAASAAPPPPSTAEVLAAEITLTERREAALAKLAAYVAAQEGASRAATAEILSLQGRSRRSVLAVAAAMLAALGATALLVVRGVRGPALALVQASRRLAAGDHLGAAVLATPPGVGPPRNELRQLGRAFGRMALDLGERERRIVDQGAELHAQHDELQVQHEELQAQQRELQSQSDELRAQDERLRDALGRLRESEARYRKLFENLSEGFAVHEMVWDEAGNPADYRFVEVNPAFERLTGVPRARAVGRRVTEVLPGVEKEWIERYGAVAKTGAPARFESFAAAIGRWFEVVAFRPEPNHFAVLFFDVTDRHAAEQALREADRRKDEFLAVLSHELRNPLAPIVSGLEVIRRAPPGSGAVARARAVVDRQVRQLVRLVDDLLDVTRITRGKVSLRRARVDLVALVRHVCEDNAAMLADRDVALEVRVPDRPLWLDADPARISQIVGNLLHNAGKFTPSGGRVTVTAEERGGRAVVRVRDTGAGIAPAVLARLFQPFVQADDSLARSAGGLGLGLALVRGLAELHGGTARAESAGEGKGAEFTVELPLRPGAAAAARAAPAEAGPRRRVLVVEDQDDAAESLADVLRLAGHEVEVARDGADGIRRAKTSRPDAVLCDIGLPGMDGYEVARRLRADGHAGTLLVALTGYALPEDLRRAREAGFDAHLTKPASPEDLEAVLAGRERLESAGAPA
ncbi:MAG TPA: ATP-binding protein [Anaeromyxobacter sp.]|nr:ATP-binding protein [Anaeromyxobacter sp.]